MHRAIKAVARARLRVTLAVLVAFAIGAAPAGASVKITSQKVVVRTAGATAMIERQPLRITFQDSRGRARLREVDSSGGSQLVPPVPQAQFGAQGSPPPALYSPFAFLVGNVSLAQEPAYLWEGNLASVTKGGLEYGATDVISVQKRRSGVRLEVGTSDPTGRRLLVDVAPGDAHGTIAVSATPTPSSGVAAVSDSFTAGSSEAFRGFGGRHNSLDQRGGQFYNWLQQENLSSGSANGLTAVTPGGGESYLFPNGEHAAYYPQSSFLSSAGYGFLLDRPEISDWRMASDRGNAWQTQVAAKTIDYTVAPGNSPTAIRDLTAVSGRQLVPPRWALGPILDRAVPFANGTASDYLAKVRDDIRQMKASRIHFTAYRIEGWQFLARSTLKRLIARLKHRHIHPMLYFRSFVGEDEIGTDDPSEYDEAIAKHYVATHADGSPYTFLSNFGANGAQIDFTKPAARRWWRGRIKQALRLGADGFMQDFGEQVQQDMHFADGETGLTMHNKLASLYHRTTYQAVRSFEHNRPHRRIYYFTRAGYSGSKGSAAYEYGNFPGDETTDWTRSSGLASLAPDMLNRGVGGAYGFSTDIGGFLDVGPYQPTSRELFLRWAEWAVLSPSFRIHGAVGSGVHTPWSFGPDVVRKYRRLATLRRRAEPLILKLWRHAHATGIPIARPLWLTDPGDRRAAVQDQEWMLGANVLVAPVVTEGARSRDVYFPRGCWRGSGLSHKRIRGPREARVAAPLGRLPYFRRCGTRPLG